MPAEATIKEEEVSQKENIIDETEKEVIEKKDALEELAREMGWIPPEDGSENITDDARTFIKNTVDINKKQRVTIDRLENSLDTIKRDVKKTMEHQTKVAQQEIEKLKKELQQKKREAITDGDVQAVEKIDEEIDKLDDEAEDAGDTKEQDPLYITWLEDNPWYDKDSEEYNKDLQKYADKVASEYEGDNIPLKTIFKIVDKEIELYKLKKEKEKEPMTKTKQRTQTDVIDTRHQTVKPAKKTARDLPPEFVDVGRRFVKDGIFKSIDEYAEDYFKLTAE